MRPKNIRLASETEVSYFKVPFFLQNIFWLDIAVDARFVDHHLESLDNFPKDLDNFGLRKSLFTVHHFFPEIALAQLQHHICESFSDLFFDKLNRMLAFELFHEPYFSV